MSDDLVSLAAPFVGAPYRLRGRTPEGWDCWGCVTHVRDRLFDKPTPSWADAYSIEDGANAVRLAAKVEQLVRDRLHAWSPADARAGAVVLLSFFDRVAHVGLMLSRHSFIHALYGCETVISRTTDPRWKSRVRGYYDA